MATPKGIIVLWSGTIANIPSGWSLCDGVGDRPDLRDRFIVGAGDSYAVDETGGANNHTHTFSANLHGHTLVGGAGVAAGPDYGLTTSNTVAAGTTNNGSSLPPFYALAYIIKD